MLYVSGQCTYIYLWNLLLNLSWRKHFIKQIQDWPTCDAPLTQKHVKFSELFVVLGSHSVCSKGSLWQWEQCMTLEIAQRPWLAPLWSWKVCVNPSDLCKATEVSEGVGVPNRSGWGSERPGLCYKQTSGNQLNSPKVTAGGQLEQRQFQNFFVCLFNEILLRLSFKCQMNILDILCNIIGYTVHIAEIVRIFNSGSPNLRHLDLIQLGTLF